MHLPRVGRYGLGARFYDVLSGERPVYRAGRVRAIELLALKPGDHVLDIACGTGLNIAPLRERVGPTGLVTGVDASAAMLAQASRRTRNWNNVSLIHGDAGDLSTLLGDDLFDAAIVTYALSIIDDWHGAWRQARERVRPGGRIAVVDMAMPTGAARLLEPAARLALLAGGVDRHRHPWNLVQNELCDVTVERLRGDHLVVAVGSTGTQETR